MMYSIYVLTCENTDLQYIGVCQDFDDRMKEHRKARGGCRKLYNAIKKYGWDSFTKEILFESWDHEYAWKTIEPFFIKEFKTKHPLGYNLTDGAEGVPGLVHTTESNEKNRQAHLGKKLPKKQRLC